MKWIGLIVGFLAAWALSELFGLRYGMLALAALAGFLLALQQARVKALSAELAALKRALLPTPMEAPLDLSLAPTPEISEVADVETGLTEGTARAETEDEADDADQPDTIPVSPFSPAIHEPHWAAPTHRAHAAATEAEGRWPAIVKSLRDSVHAWRQR